MTKPQFQRLNKIGEEPFGLCLQLGMALFICLAKDIDHFPADINQFRDDIDQLRALIGYFPAIIDHFPAHMANLGLTTYLVCMKKPCPFQSGMAFIIHRFSLSSSTI